MTQIINIDSIMAHNKSSQILTSLLHKSFARSIARPSHSQFKPPPIPEKPNKIEILHKYEVPKKPAALKVETTQQEQQEEAPKRQQRQKSMLGAKTGSYNKWKQSQHTSDYARTIFTPGCFLFQEKEMEQAPEWFKKFKTESKFSSYLASEQREFDQLKERLLDQYENRQKSKEDFEDITILEYTKYLKNKLVLDSPTLLVMVLNSFVKKLYRTETIGGGLSDDMDVFLPQNAEYRKRVQGVMLSRQEVKNAVEKVLKNLGHLSAEKITAVFVFLAKSGVPISENELKIICKEYRRVATSTEKVGTKQALHTLFQSIAIFSKMAAKVQIHDNQERDAEPISTKLDQHKKQLLFTQLISDTLYPMLEIYYKRMSLADINMTLSGMNSVVGFSNAEFPNTIIAYHLKHIEKASNIELYGLFDLCLDLSLKELQQGGEGAQLSATAVGNLKTMLAEICVRLESEGKESMKALEVVGYLKSISIKKTIMPSQDGLDKLTEHMIKLCEAFLSATDQTLTMRELSITLSSFHRYEAIKELSPGLLLKSETLIDAFLKSPQSNQLSDAALMRLITASLYYYDQIGFHKIDQLVGLFLERCDKELTPELIRLANGIMYQVKKGRKGIEGGKYIRLRAILYPAEGARSQTQ